MRKKIIGIILLVLIVFGGYKLFANVSANNVNSNSIQFSYEDIPAYNGDNPYVVINDNKPYFTLNNESTVLKTILVRKGLLPIDVLCASMQDNALECLGLQIKEGHICRKEKYHIGMIGAPTFMRQFIDKLKSGELKIETCPQVEVESEFTREYIVEQLESYQRLLDSKIIEDTTKEEQGPVKKLVSNNEK